LRCYISWGIQFNFSLGVEMGELNKQLGHSISDMIPQWVLSMLLYYSLICFLLACPDVSGMASLGPVGKWSPLKLMAATASRSMATLATCKKPKGQV
jgi:uncharacterized membrane protein YbhN (UPF0104 family)